MFPIKYLTIHCAATRENVFVSEKTIKEIGLSRFGQPAYHLVIDQDGEYYRHLPDDKRGAHVGGHNTGNIGICYIGGLDKFSKPKDTRSREQKKTMRTLIRTYQARYPGIQIMGHRDWSPDKNKNGIIDASEWLKDCPCFDVKTWLEQRMPIE